MVISMVLCTLTYKFDIAIGRLFIQNYYSILDAVRFFLSMRLVSFVFELIA